MVIFNLPDTSLYENEIVDTASFLSVFIWILIVYNDGQLIMDTECHGL